MGRSRARVRTFLSNALLVVISVLVTVVVAEVGWRAALSSDSPYMKRYRVPERYAYFESDDYWKLHYMFGGPYRPPRTPHPLLGWVGGFDRETYTHAEHARIANRRPVLLYGDSFASCAVDPCFQAILNGDPGFAKHHFLLNYGVGGYGVDQIFLLYQNSIGQFENPFVIVSMLTEDLDRSVLSVRTGQKPFYRLVDDRLVLSGIPMDPSPESFFAQHPPRIPSYWFRMLVYSDAFQRFVHREGPPASIKNYFRTEPRQMRERIEQINRHIILEIIRDLRQRRLEFVVLIFHPQWALTRSDDWRDDFLVTLLDSTGVPYLSSKAILKAHARQHQARYEDYYLADNGHPNAHQNQIIADELKTHLLTRASSARRRPDSSVAGAPGAIPEATRAP